jgi:hypothetical protein
MATETTHFLNVDLEIDSRWNLQPLVSALGKKVIVLYADRYKRTYMARLELARLTNDPNVIIRSFCAMIRDLPRAERKLWTSAKLRDFSIGVKAGFKPSAYDLALTPQTLKEASEINARIVFTLYASDLNRIDSMQVKDTVQSVQFCTSPSVRITSPIYNTSQPSASNRSI